MDRAKDGCPGLIVVDDDHRGGAQRGRALGVVVEVLTAGVRGCLRGVRGGF